MLVWSCNRDNEKPPAGILSKPEMIKVLSEVYLTEEKINRLGVNRDSAIAAFDFVSSRIFEKTGVADSVFDASFDYYNDRPKEMEQIYTALVDSLQLMEQRTPDLPK